MYSCLKTKKTSYSLQTYPLRKITLIYNYRAFFILFISHLFWVFSELRTTANTDTVDRLVLDQYIQCTVLISAKLAGHNYENVQHLFTNKQQLT